MIFHILRFSILYKNEDSTNLLRKDENIRIRKIFLK